MTEPPKREDGDGEPPQGPTYVGPREWPPAEMRWPPPPGADPPQSSERPAPWQALLLCVSIALVAQLAATLVFAAWSRTGTRAEELRDLKDIELLARAAALPGGLETMVLPVQATLAAFALLLAVALPGGVRVGLGLAPPRVRLASWVFAIAGTLVVQQVWTRIVTSLYDMPEHLRMLEDALVQRPLLVGLAIAVLAPAVCEELFFRGWLQRRLRVAWGAGASVALSAVIFAAYHVEPVHVLGVFPIGLWIAWWAERTRSTQVAIACHAANNGFALLALRLGWE